MPRIDSPSFFVQARTSSTRLPGKTILPFYEGKTIVELVLERLLEKFPSHPVFLLTTKNPNDDLLATSLSKYPVTIFRGDEQNVLKRFTDAASLFEVDQIIRVCADNPFVLPEFIEELFESNGGNHDYISHSFHGTPSMKCHFGLFAERVSRSALDTASRKTIDNLYLEHVTNFVYSNPAIFHVNLIDKSEALEKISYARLTIDTPEDFESASLLYKEVCSLGGLSLENLIKALQNHPELELKMKKLQLQNQK